LIPAVVAFVPRVILCPASFTESLIFSTSVLFKKAPSVRLVTLVSINSIVSVPSPPLITSFAKKVAILNLIVSFPAPALIVLRPFDAVIVSAPPAVLMVISPVTLPAWTSNLFVLTFVAPVISLNTPSLIVTSWSLATSASLSVSNPLTLLNIAISVELIATSVNSRISFVPSPPSKISSFVRWVDCILNVSFPSPPT